MSAPSTQSTQSNNTLKCGIEIHQQLATSKLFCRCPSQLRDEKPDFEITRKIRAVMGEMGQVDIAAKEEMAKGKHFVYQGYDETTCLVELDEQPPLPINTEAFAVGIIAGKLLNVEFVDNAQVMRKTVVDGSNTSGFQRTVLLGTNGHIEMSFGRVSIQTFVLEEDSCRNIREERDRAIYRLDRLGIPLIEIATGAEIRTPEQAKEVAEKLGLILRSTGKVKRGIGTIRQDVNVSIPEGNRVEIKGAQDLKLLPKLVELEAARQRALVAIRGELQKRHVRTVKATITDISKILKNSQSKLISAALHHGQAVLGIKLEHFAGLLGKDVQPKRRFGTELSDRAKTAAGVKGLIHSDEMPGYGLTEKEISAIKNELGCKNGENDAFVLVADDKDRAERALHAVIERANEALIGVPGEVRKANPDGTTSYERHMPGAARMYPETDIPPILLSKKVIDAAPIPELIEDRIKRYEKLGMGKDLAELAAKSERWILLDDGW